MGGGNAHTTMTSNPNLVFKPDITDGGKMAIGGSVGTGNVGQQGGSSATGSSTGLNLNLDMSGMGAAAAAAALQNLQAVPVYVMRKEDVAAYLL
eukprot:CAMPEP_0170485210 /NCGR_PEP_ID=MMETSP0208-20121228/4521_1 /TAXON_ID=197538 /ORGANISM="Strombidium inclinatum, Strain S3" /LENGTH=93 /DNA_ID=CAMNT_0010758787 /DNA_START=33 /DNA_END=314 /DNA_ORIENTATION=+